MAVEFKWATRLLCMGQPISAHTSQITNFKSELPGICKTLQPV